MFMMEGLLFLGVPCVSCFYIVVVVVVRVLASVVKRDAGRSNSSCHRCSITSGPARMPAIFIFNIGRFVKRILESTKPCSVNFAR